jgi:hypothetical protein
MLIAQHSLLFLRPPPRISALHLVSASLHLGIARLLPFCELGHLLSKLPVYSLLSCKSLRVH